MPFPFAETCVLLQRHEDIELHQPPILKAADRHAQAKAVTESWFKSHRLAIAQLNADSSVALLSTLLPEKRTDRVYNIKASKLLHMLSRCLGLSAPRTKDLLAYTQPGRGDLGQCLERVLTNGGPPGRPPVTVDEVDEMLHMLAGGSAFSDPSIRRLSPGSSEARDALIGNVLRRLQPCEAKWLVRLILKDLTPVRVSEADILKGYHFLLPGVLRFQNQFEAAITLLKGPLREYPSHPDPRSERLHFKSAAEKLKPMIGVKVGRPNFHKARSIDNCIHMLGGTQWVLERKYDGEYCEIHIDLTRASDPFKCITIFSKSAKNSTEDRKALLATLVQALRLGRENCKIKHRAIVLGEMVVYSDTERRILPFDEIRKHVVRSGRAIGTDADSHPKTGEHLAIAFFDLLLLDDEVVMNRSIDERRQWLREVYRKIRGRAIGAEWKVVNFGPEKPAKRLLMQQFAASCAQRCEGLVLKPCGVPYFAIHSSPADYSHSYIKLKKDYLSNMGDEADFSVVGGSYKAQQAAISGVPGVRWTSFHLGCLTNKAEVLRFDARPRFRVVGSIQQEHCIPKPVLQAANALGQFCAEPHKPGAMPENFDLEIAAGMRIDSVFSRPFVFEVLGSGFEKPSNCNFYMLRHPRVKKLHEDRTFKEAIGMQELQEQASAARSMAPELESQETRRWLEKLERKSRRKFERERTDTPKTRTTGTPSTTGVSSGRTRIVATVAAGREADQIPPSSPCDASALEGTTLVETSQARAMLKRHRGEASLTPCPVTKKGRSEAVSKAGPLNDITNQTSTAPSSSAIEQAVLKRVSGLFKPLPAPSQTIPHCTESSSCPLGNSTIFLSPCIAQTPYIATDLLSSHLSTGCLALTRRLTHWQREVRGDESRDEETVVSESPAWQGRRKVVLAEGRRRGATREVVREMVALGIGRDEEVEVWDWRVLEDDGMRETWQLGIVRWDPTVHRTGVVQGREWLEDVGEIG